MKQVLGVFSNPRLNRLLIVSSIILFTLLGARDIWTQEHRWADIVSGMFFRNDFLHPYLGEHTYYDKPLLSYWLMAGIAALTGTLSTWALRLPSAFAGLLAIWSVYRLGSRMKDQQLGVLAGWMLLTTFFFVFWARTSSADMLNLAGIIFAVSWYYEKRSTATFYDYAVFFLIVALTSLCKGLIGAIVPFIAVVVDVALQHSWKQHLKPKMFLAFLPAFIIYLLPFMASSYVGGDDYGQNGLYLVYRENILRYFQPFDHKGPIYTYFVYLPIYLFPWTLFFIPAMWSVVGRWKTLSINTKWISLTSLAVFLFLTASGSRRSYYVLPLIPFVILFTAEWILAIYPTSEKRCVWARRTAIVSLLLIFLGLDLIPAWYYSKYGINHFALTLKDVASQEKPWKEWDVVMLDAESKLSFYLHLPPDSKFYGIEGGRNDQTITKLAQAWPISNKKSEKTIFVTRKVYQSLLQPYFVGYRVVEMPINNKFVKTQNEDIPIAFIPS